MCRKLTTKVGQHQLRTPQSQGAAPIAPHPKPDALCRDSGDYRKLGNPLVKPQVSQKAPEARQKQQQIPPPPYKYFVRGESGELQNINVANKGFTSTAPELVPRIGTNSG